MMKPIFSSLNRKIIVFLIFVLGISLAITTFFSVRMERSEALESAKDKVKSFAEVVQANMFRVMEGGQCKDIPEIIRVLASSKEFMRVRIFDKGGRIIESTREEEKGKILHLTNLSALEKDVILTNSHRGEKIFSALRPFYNDAKCKRCHNEKDKVLAYLNVDLSLAPIEAKLRSFTNMQVLSAFCILFMMSGAMFFFFSRFINGPILNVSRKMSEVEEGNFDVEIPIKTEDELGHLASSFNFMVKNLQEMRKREDQQRILLEGTNEDFRKRIQELNILYESSKAIAQSLQVEKILRMAIENVTRSLGFDRVVLAVIDEKSEALVGKWGIGIDEEIVQQVNIPKEEIKGVLYETFQKREPIIVKDTSAYPIIERREAKKCWEVLNCQQQGCPVYQRKALRCWMVLGTDCHLDIKTFEEKMRVCGMCLFLKEIVKRSDIVNLLLFGSHSLIAVPLSAREQVLGILLADKLHSEKEITDEDLKLLMTFVSHVSVAIENAILYQKLEKKVDLGQRQLQETNKQLELKVEELNEIRSFNESILQNLYGGIVTYTKEGIITFMNQSGAEILGWEGSAEVLGRSIHEVLCGEKKETSLFYKSLEGNGEFSGEMELIKKGGEKVPVEVFLSYLRDKEENITGVTGIFQDITGKREIEARMHRMDKLASLGQLASGIAHEIKNPLAGIGSAIQVLSTSIQFNDSQKEVVKEVLKQIHRLDGTIKNLLSFAKPGEPKLAPANLNEVIDTVLFLVSQQVKKQNIQPHLDLQTNLPKTMMDPQKVQQAILNVVLNAVEAMPSGGKLTISTREKIGTGPSKKERPYVSLVISDTGTGVSKEVLAQIFNPFYTTKPAGTGLGLSITQRIIEQHSGRIDIKSEVGKGTSFAIDLPV